MALDDIKDPRAVRAAIAEYRRVGRQAFLNKYGFREAREYYLVVEGERFDSKAIMGAAHGYAFPTQGPLKPKEFSGGAATVAPKLEELGFRVERVVPGVQASDPKHDVEREVERTGDFDPSTIQDARRKILAAIVRRQGQPAFRRALLTAYGGKCAITGCASADVLEAAHIVPYQGPQTNRVTNGLLLRSDVHTLFDLGLIAIDEGSYAVIVSPALGGSEYAQLHSRVLELPRSLSDRPSSSALRAHRDAAGL